MSSLRFLLPWSLACSPTVRDSGTIIGNPEAEPSALRVAYGTDVRTRSASVFLEAVSGRTATARRRSSPWGDRRPPGDARLRDPPGGVVRGRPRPEGPLVLEGVHAGGST